MKPRVLVTGVGSKYGGTETVVSRLIGVLSDRFVFDSVSYSKFKQPEFFCGDNSYIREPKRNENIYRYERFLDDFYKENADRYIALWHNANSFSNIDDLRYAKRYGIATRICHYHSSGVIGKWYNKILHEIQKSKAANLSTCRLAASEEAGLFAFGKAPFSVLANPVDLERFAFDPAARTNVRESFGLDDCFVIGTVGRLAPEKNQAFLLDLLPSILSRKPNTRLVIVGDGPERKHLEQKADRLGVKERVLFAGMRPDVERFLSAFDVFAFPSLFEGLGLAAVEAQANELPVVLSENVPRLAVASKSADSISLDDPHAWSEALIGKSRDTFVRDEALINRFDIEVVANTLSDHLLGL